MIKRNIYLAFQMISLNNYTILTINKNKYTFQIKFMSFHRPSSLLHSSALLHKRDKLDIYWRQDGNREWITWA